MAWEKGKPRSSETKQKMNKFTDAQKKEAIEFYLSGLSTNKVAKQMGCGDELIRRILIEAGIPRRSRSEAIKKSLSEPETRKKMSDSHMGVSTGPRTEATKSKISDARKRNWNDPEYRKQQTESRSKLPKGELHPNFGRKASEKTKKLISQKAKKRFEDEDFKNKMIKIFNSSRKTTVWKEKQSKARKELWKNEDFKQKALIALSGKKETSLEKIVRECLDDLEIAYEPQMVIGRAIVDFFIIGTNKIIEADGHYWHSKPEVAARDIRRDKWLESEGYSILRIPEVILKDNPRPLIEEFLNL